MSLVKYRIKDVATDFDLPWKEVMEVVGKFYEKPKSNTRVLTEEELNVVFDYITKTHQIASLEQVFAVQPKKEEKPAEKPTEKAPEKPVSEEKKPAAPAAAPKAEQKAAAPTAPAKPQKPAEPERRRERRVVDTSAVQVNTNRFDDVDNLVSERVQNFQGGKQKFGKKGQQQNKKDNKFKGNKSKNEEQEKRRLLHLYACSFAPSHIFLRRRSRQTS